MSKSEVKNFLVYNLPDEDVNIDIIIKADDIWLNQKGMSELFGIDRTGIGKHLKNIFDEGELDEKVVCANFTHTTEYDGRILKGDATVNKPYLNKKLADKKAKSEYNEFNKFQNIVSDFDKAVFENSVLEDKDE